MLDATRIQVGTFFALTKPCGHLLHKYILKLRVKENLLSAELFQCVCYGKSNLAPARIFFSYDSLMYGSSESPLYCRIPKVQMKAGNPPQRRSWRT